MPERLHRTAGREGCPKRWAIRARRTRDVPRRLEAGWSGCRQHFRCNGRRYLGWRSNGGHAPRWGRNNGVSRVRRGVTPDGHLLDHCQSERDKEFCCRRWTSLTESNDECRTGQNHGHVRGASHYRRPWRARTGRSPRSTNSERCAASQRDRSPAIQPHPTA